MNSRTFTLSSPLRVVITVPSTPTQSPRSRSSNASWPSGPTTFCETNSCTSPVPSRSVPKRELALAPDQQQPARDPHRDVGLLARARARRTRRAARRSCGRGRSAPGTGRARRPGASRPWRTAGRTPRRCARRHVTARFRSKTICSPRSVSHGSWCWIVRENGRISSARPPVAITVHSPSSSWNRSTSASTWPLKPYTDPTGSTRRSSCR